MAVRISFIRVVSRQYELPLKRPFHGIVTLVAVKPPSQAGYAWKNIFGEYEADGNLLVSQQTV